VERLRAGAARISGAHPGGRVPVPATGDEITRLASTLNAMLARIDDAAARQQQFVGDASHELRSTPANGGSGLGLAISRQIARRHHGSITVDDSPTTTCTVRLPLPDTARTEGPDSAPRPPA